MRLLSSINFLGLRSLIFYIGSVVAVVNLFSQATAYGEKNLKAPRNVDGYYRLTGSKLPLCFGGQAVNLVIQQSGIYLNGSLVPSDALAVEVKAAESRPKLTGRWLNQKLMLTGVGDGLMACQGTVTIQGIVQGKNELKGTLKIGKGTANFTAKQEPRSRDSSSH